VLRRPTEIVLTARVARRYYLEDRSKTEIAQELGISRFRVARLLDLARRDGMVRIEIRAPDSVDTELSEDLQRVFGLTHAIVLDLPDDDPTTLRRMLGNATGDVLREIVTPRDVLGVAWARSLDGIAGGLGKIAPCPVVQLTGALPDPEGSDIINLVRSVARAGGGTPHVFYAPLVAPDAASARVVRRHQDVARAMQLAAEVTVAVVGIGAWGPGLSTVFDNVDENMRNRTAALGAIGEISGALIDANGHAVASPLSRRIIGVTAEHLEGIRTVLSVAYGVGKAAAVAAALRGGLVNGLVTHSTLARALLAHAPDDLQAHHVLAD
jgi:DNA-binding transcriptional regulator LsrR (DeoR family)